MDATQVNAFVEGVSDVFTTMLDTRPQRRTVRISSAPNGKEQLTSLIGISGALSGVVALRFPPPTALQLAGRFLGAEPVQVNAEVIDAIAELVNMVAGSAKARFNHDPPLDLSLPTVVLGSEYRLKYPSKSAWLEVPFECDAGPFAMELTFSSE